MKAIVHTTYGSPDVLQFQEIENPTPDENQVLVKVHAASINALDWHELTADIFLIRLGGGLRNPKNPRLGVDFAGQVEAVGSSVKDFQPGDAVFGVGAGSFAEYVGGVFSTEKSGKRPTPSPESARLTVMRVSYILCHLALRRGLTGSPRPYQSLRDPG